ncbi:hypothetical protein [Serratia sp. DD3]|uniref:hypothetical protein n=1 Tax=Serratia sp. DD3 TaxID=1410619 RepID=UPI0004D5BCE0|nr:hypothetical protein [Serratia sp. DD3]KEY58484.1 hypothetical protein SRDD_27310 [Serratia sp. DD3]
MYINIEHIPELLGINGDIGEKVLQALFEFTLVFSLAEQRLMDGYAKGANSEKYASILVDDNDINAEQQFEYFKERYISAGDATNRLESLCPHAREKTEIYNALNKQEPSRVEMANAVMKIAIRLRHNLFHGRKWEYMLREQEDNLNMVTKLLSQYLRLTREQ